MIKLLEERFTSIWENVIILAKEGKEDTKQSFQVQGKRYIVYFGEGPMNRESNTVSVSEEEEDLFVSRQFYNMVSII